jgi:pimeloyl-ACP methyl ester carboxylesterase
VSTFDRSLYPFAPHHFDVGGGVRMHYVDEGPAVPAGTVLMVHGNPMEDIRCAAQKENHLFVFKDGVRVASRLPH